ncbi:hypothetical protein CAFEA_00110 [Corynebacterium afermentans subsp. afermentans]|uniref:Uncharacterized protein n=1 Tax=Corynebacterium afermentans TaxID=38286 RepID=A0A9X8R6U1_9CORY|nr:hypothetical protein Caferm_01140 [Corynebacterium afermentans subsp. afermentans]WJY55661.1 hypothetical protein CAFEA_00110 [Corynebacterium afermentans subsp. afermentans]SIQ74040.1 hypothetical protein SAMN05421802_1295 [Corynebacterium afermentans]
MTLHNANLKKRIMTAMVTGVMATGAVVSAPLAEAASENTSSQQIVGAYEKLSGADLARYDQIRQQTVKEDQAIDLLPSSVGAGWCIDWGLGNPWDSGNYEVRKLTGASGRVGNGDAINEDVHIAAINVVKALQKDYKAYAAGDSSKAKAIKDKNAILRALLSNQLGYLNQAREEVLRDHNTQFENLTGFRIDRHDAPKGEPNYYLIKQPNHAKIAQTVKPGEYVTVLVPLEYDFNIVPRKSFQRLIPVPQPGLDPDPQPTPEPSKESTPPSPTKPIVETVTITESPVTTMVTRPQEVVTTVMQPGTTVTQPGTTVTQPGTTVTQPGTTVIEPGTTVTQPGTTVTEPGTTVTQPATTATRPEQVTTVTSTNTAVTETVATTITPEPTTTTTTVTDVEKYFVEKYYERVKEVSEHYYFAGFTRDEKSKVIEMPEKIGNKWTFEIIKGSDIVVVERSEDGKLVITPREDFEGEGEVEILITDDKGNQHIYRIKVTDTVAVQDSLNVKVNNFFYTLNAGSEDRITTIPWKPGEDIDWGLGYDKDGNLIQPEHGEVEILKDEEKGTVTVKAGEDYTGNVIVRITEDSGEVRENIVTVENKTSKFDVTREILNTSTAKIENRGGDYKILGDGEDKVTIEEDGDVWVVTPKDGATGDVEILFTDENGFEYKYTLKLIEDKNSGPTVTQRDLEYKSKKPDTLFIEYIENHTAEIVAGDDVAKIEKKGDNWVVTPTNPKGGQATVHIKDENGRLVAVWIVDVAPQPEQEVENQEVNRDVNDRATVEISRGSIDFNRLKVVEGGEYLTEGADGSDFGDKDNLNLKFKPVPEGETRTVKVVEYAKTADGEKPVKTYTYTVEPSPVREMNYTITADNELKLYGTKFRVAKGGDLLAEQPEKDASEIKVTPKRDAKGTLVIENVSDDGYVFERYTFEITPGRSAEVTPENTTMGWNQTATIASEDGEKVEVLEGEDLVDITREGDKLLVTGENKKKTGKALIQVGDKRGMYAKYEITLTEPKRNGLYTYKISTSTEFQATLVNDENRFQVIKGADAFEAPEEKNGQWVLRPKADKVGETGIVAEYNKDGEEINRYKLEIVESKTTGARQQTDFLIEGDAKELKKLDEGNKVVVVSGSDLVDLKDNGGSVALTAKNGSAGKVVRAEERNSNGDLVRTISYAIYPAGTRTAEGNVISENNDLPVVIDHSIKNDSPVNVTFPDNVNGIVFTKGKEYFEEVKKTDEGVTLVPRKDLKDGTYEASYLLVGPDGQAYGEREIEINVNVESGNRVEQKGSSAELDGKCIAGIVGLTAPLLLAIPLGILSQVQIPGLEGVSAQINAAVRDANDRIQRGLGIYDEDRASRAAGIQGAFSIENPQMLGMAAGALGAISLGLLAVDGVMRACGAEEYTSSYMIGKATGSETLMNGSSGKADKKDNNSADEAKGSSKAEDSSNEEK